MGTINVQATTTTSPDPGYGGLAISGIGVTGHSSSTASCSSFASSGFGSDADSQIRSGRWGGFPTGPGGTRKSVKLKFDWSTTRSGSASADSGDGGSADSDVELLMEYSVNNGGAWSTVVLTTNGCNNINSPFSDGPSGSESISLSLSQDLTQVLLREKNRAFTDAGGGEFSGASANASTAVTVSNILIEVVTSTPHLITMM